MRQPVWFASVIVSVFGGCGCASDPSPSAVDAGLDVAADGGSARNAADGGGAQAAGAPATAAGEPAQAGRSAAGSSAGTGGHASDPQAGAAADPCADTLLCDDLETNNTDTLDASRFQVVMPNCSGDAEVHVDTTIAHSGTRSVRVRAGGGYCDHAFIQPQLTLPATGPWYGRFFVRIATALGDGHVTLMTLHDEHDGKDLRLGGQSKVVVWNRESDDATLPELSPAGIAASVTLQPNTWTCLELMVDDSGKTLQTWIDERVVAGLQVAGDPTPDIDAQWQRKVDWAPKLTSVRWGWESYSGSPNTLWFDDLVIATARVGCSSSASAP